MKLFFGLLISFALSWRCAESVLCEIGEALKDPNNPLTDRVCVTGTSNCPSEYVCTPRPGGLIPSATTGVCCPSKAMLCAEPQTPGFPCGSSTPSQRFYFDFNQGGCQMFMYNGCFGNNNNFFTREDCERICLGSLCPKGTPLRSGVALMRCQVGASQCPLSYDCVPTSAGTSALGSVCCPSALTVCSEPLMQGNPCSFGTQPTQRFYYEPNSRTCQVFQYTGCGGNNNNFATAIECQQFCSGSSSSQLCPVGSVPAPGTTPSTPCNAAFCPAGFACQNSPTLGTQYCCSVGGATGFCPAGTVPQPGAGAVPTMCNPQFASTCIAGYTCRQSPQNSQWYCCSGSSFAINVCPSGSTPPPGLPSTPCTDSTQCTAGYVCEYSSQDSQYYCCSSRDPRGQYCPVGSNPSPNPTSCVIGAANVCPTGYTCRQGLSVFSAYCCSTTQQQTQLCAPGQSPAPGTTVSTTCLQFPGSCTPGFSCQQSPYNQLFYCCSSSTSGSQLCPAGSQPAPGISVTTPCYPVLPCQPGYTCQRSPFSNQMYCCSSSTSSSQLCPAGWTPSPDATVISPCQPMTTCRLGYSCQRSPMNGQSYCCTPGGSTTSLCPVGSSPAPGVTPGTTCDGGQPCPSQYSCQRSPTTGLSYCCSYTSQDSQLCPAGTSPAPGTTVTSTCNAFTGCSPGYSCQASPLNGQTYCCSDGGSSSSLCPAGSTPAPGVTFGTLCSSDASCQVGYSCQRSPTNGFQYCCSQSSASSCGLGGTPLLQPSTNQPVVCTTGGTQCPAPYSCQVTSSGFGFGTGICCLNSGGGNQDCPQGFNPYRPNGITINCGFGNSPQQQYCQPLAQCMMSPLRGTYICCSAFIRSVAKPVSAISTSCKYDEDCKQLKGTTCVEKSCQCANGFKPSQGETCDDGSDAAKKHKKRH